MFEDSKAGERGRQRSLERQQNLPARDLLLVCASIRTRQLTVVDDELVLDVRDRGDQRLERARLFGRRVEDDRHSSLHSLRAGGAEIMA